MNIIREVAKKNGVSEKEVRKEMKIAIRAAMQSTDPIAQFFWNLNLQFKCNRQKK